MVSSSHEAAPWLGPRLEEEGLQRYARTIRERWRVVVACVVIALAGAGLYVAIAPKVYQAGSQLLVTPVDPSDPTTVGLGLISTSNDPGRDVATAASLITTVQVAQQVISTLHLNGETPRKLLTKVGAVPLANTSIVSITASASSPARAQAIANAFAQQTVALRTQRVHAIEDQTIALLRAEVSHQTPAQSAGGSESVASRLAGLEALRAQPDPTISVAALADRPTSQASPRKALSLAAGLFAGLVLGLAAAFVLQNLDPRLRREEQLRELFRLPILSRVPRESGVRGQGVLLPERVSSGTAEAYRTLRATLFGSEHPEGIAQSVLITGSSPSEGKSSTALNLANSLAQTGRQVILIEADLRRPSLAQSLRASMRFGLIAVLSGQVPVDEALVTVPDYPDNLRLLLVERPEPSAADRLGLPIAHDMLRQAKSLADYVVIDSPPLSQIVDALPLAQAVDQVLIVARLGTSRIGALAELGELLLHNSVRPLGLVLVDVERSSRGGYYYSAAPRARQVERSSLKA